MKQVAIALLIGSLLLNSGCATMFHGSTDRVLIRSEVPGSKIYVDDRYIGTQEAVAEISKSDDPVIRVRKDGCTDGVRPLERKFDAVTLLGLLIDFGLISILLVDWASTGAVQKAKYNNLLVNPNCQ